MRVIRRWRRQAHRLLGDPLAVAGTLRRSLERLPAHRRRRYGAVAVIRLAGVVGVLVTATAAGSITQQGTQAPVSIHATLSGGSGPPLIEIGGTDDQDPSTSSRYQITGYLRGVPCTGETYRFLVVATLRTARTTYDARVVLRQTRGPSLRCATRLRRDLGRKSVRIQIDPKVSDATGPKIIVTGRRRSDTVIEGWLTTRSLVCHDAWLRVSFSSRSQPVSLLYDVRFRSVSVNGRRCA